MIKVVSWKWGNLGLQMLFVTEILCDLGIAVQSIPDPSLPALAKNMKNILYDEQVNQEKACGSECRFDFCSFHHGDTWNLLEYLGFCSVPYTSLFMGKCDFTLFRDSVPYLSPKLSRIWP